ncbi:hypothetical protein EB001_02470 [bacterium]|nr:hypothetical protein [bacterium]
MVDSREKGARAETVARDALRKLSKLQWERTPGSGALDPKHLLKGDLYIPGEKNLFVVEVKHYAEDHLTSALLTHKKPQFFEWWEQAVRQGKQVKQKPLLIFKFDRSKLFVGYEDIPSGVYNYMFVNAHGYEVYISLLEDWYENEQPKFIA